MSERYLEIIGDDLYMRGIKIGALHCSMGPRDELMQLLPEIQPDGELHSTSQKEADFAQLCDLIHQMSDMMGSGDYVDIPFVRSLVREALDIAKEYGI